MRTQIESYQIAMADMAAQAEVDRQNYAHRISELQKETETPITQNVWTDQDMKDGEVAEQLRLRRVAQRNEDDQSKMEEQCQIDNARRAELYRQSIAQRASPFEPRAETPPPGIGTKPPSALAGER